MKFLFTTGKTTNHGIRSFTYSSIRESNSLTDEIGTANTVNSFTFSRLVRKCNFFR